MYKIQDGGQNGRRFPIFIINLCTDLPVTQIKCLNICIKAQNDYLQIPKLKSVQNPRWQSKWPPFYTVDRFEAHVNDQKYIIFKPSRLRCIADNKYSRPRK